MTTFRSLALLLALVVPGGKAAAQTFTWNNATGNWSAGSSWGGTAPAAGGGSGVVLNFGGSASYTATNDLTGTFVLNQLNLSDTGAATIAGNAVSFGGSSAALTVAAGSGAATISAPITFGANTTVTNNSANLLTLGAATYGAGTATTYTGGGNVTAGGTQTFGGTASLTYTGTGTLALGPTAAGSAFAFGSGTVTINNGTSGGGNTGTLTLNDTATGGNYTGTGTINLSNFSSGAFNIGNMSGVSGTLNVNAGTVKFAGSTGGDLFGNSLVLNVASGATFDFAGNAETMGAISGTGTITGANVSMQITGSRTWGGVMAGTMTFSTGAAAVNYTFTGTNTSTGTTTVVASSSLTLGNGGTTGTVNGAIANAGTLNFNRSDAAQNISKVISGAGTIAQIGSGTTTLSGANTFTGPVVVTNGTLAFASAGAFPTGNTQTTVNGGVLDLSVISGGYTFGTGRTLTVGRTGTAANDVLGTVTVGGTLNVAGTGVAGTATFRDALTLNAATAPFDLSNSTATGNDLLAVGGNLTLTGTTALQLNATAGALANGTYTLFTYGGTLTGDTSNLSLSGLGGGTTRQTFTLNAGTGTNSAVTVAVAGSAANLTWTAGASTTWDLVTTSGNFSGAADTRFYNLDTVTFGNTGAGTVTLVGTLQPGSVTVNSSADYTFSGTGSLAGSGSLTKQGTGTLTIGTANTYTGLTTVSGGTLTFASGGSIAGPVTVSGGTVAANQAGAIGGNVTVTSGALNATIAGALAGSSLSVSGGAVTANTGATPAATLPGTVSITGGIVTVQSLANFASTAAIGLNGGTLAVTGTSGTNTNQVITVGTSGGTIDVASGFVMSVLGNQLLGAGNTLTKTGGGTLTIGSSGTSTVGTYQVSAGALRETSNRVTTTTVVNVATGATFYNFDTTTFTVGSPLAFGSLTLNGGDGANLTGVTGNSNILGTSTGSGAYLHTLDEAGNSVAGVNVAITLNGQNRFTISGLGRQTTVGTNDTISDTFQKPITGSGGITKDGEGTMLIASASTYTGATVITNGTFGLTGSGSINGTPSITVQTSGKFDVSAVTGGYTLGGTNAQVLGGTGTVTGPVTVANLGTIRGDTGTGTGTLTTGSVTVQNGGRLAVQLGTGTTASRLDASATGSVLDLNANAIVAPAGTLGAGNRVIAALASGSGGLVVGGTTYDTDATIATYTQTAGATGLQPFGSLQIDLAGVSLNTGDVFTLSRSGNTLVLAFTPNPVPEPGLVLALGAAALGLVRRTSRRR